MAWNLPSSSWIPGYLCDATEAVYPPAVHRVRIRPRASSLSMHRLSRIASRTLAVCPGSSRPRVRGAPEWLVRPGPLGFRYPGSLAGDTLRGFPVPGIGIPTGPGTIGGDPCVVALFLMRANFPPKYGYRDPGTYDPETANQAGYGPR
eukprot:674415-Rhodomonas_salina.1